MRSPKLGSLAEWSGLLQWQIDWQILKAQKWGAASGARFSIHEKPLFARLADGVLDHG
jgi:hypothetical protein